MTIKHYLNDSYTTTFEARIARQEQTDAGLAVILEETWFYPESGGQPADQGTIGSARVTGVQIRDSEIVHYLDSEPEPVAEAIVDWQRRFDHMQQHSGQHLLTAAAIHLFDADTVGFHLGEQHSTIDVTMPELSAEQASGLEALCQRWISEARTIYPRVVSPAEFEHLDLRKKNLPDHVEGDIRLIGIDGIDLCNCGGTHLRSTAEVQLIKITASEKVRDTTRIHFLAGKRAVEDYSLKHLLVSDLAGHFTTGIEDLKQIVLKQQRENKQQNARIKKLEKRLAEAMAAAELQAAKPLGNYKILVKDYDDLGADMLRLLAQGITRLDDAVIFAGITEENGRATLICAAGKTFQGDLGEAVNTALPLFDGKGGGRGTYAQAAGLPGNSSTVLEAVNKKLGTVTNL